MRANFIRILVAASVFASLLAVSSEPAVAQISTPCRINTPADPVTNYQRITNCLATDGGAELGSGIFEIPTGIEVPTGKQLLGTLSYPVLRLVAVPGWSRSNFLVKPRASSEVAFLQLDANTPPGCASQSPPAGSGCMFLPNAATVSVENSNAFIHDNHILGAAEVGTTGVYVFSGSGSLIFRNQIRNNYYGTIFSSALASSSPNSITGNGIFDNACDAVTLAGYGVVSANHVYRNGWACANGPIPGGGIYAHGNQKGAQVLDNRIEANCGSGLDIDESAGFTFRGNTSRDPGYRWGGQYSYCSGGAAAFMDLASSTIESNVFENNNYWNRPDSCPSCDRVYGRYFQSSQSFSDLPGNGNTVIAMTLARRPRDIGATSATHLQGVRHVSGNTIRGNVARASCRTSSPGCVGVGIFVSRSTGYGPGASWSGATTNYFTRNNVFGSDVGSVRGGSNWWAANSVCTSTQTDPDCNNDDYQHTYPMSHWHRSDIGLEDYSPSSL